MSRDEAKELIESNGGKVSSSVSSKNSFLVLGENGGSKVEDAKKYNVPSIPVENLLLKIK